MLRVHKSVVTWQKNEADIALSTCTQYRVIKVKERELAMQFWDERGMPGILLIYLVSFVLFCSFPPRTRTCTLSIIAHMMVTIGRFSLLFALLPMSARYPRALWPEQALWRSSFCFALEFVLLLLLLLLLRDVLALLISIGMTINCALNDRRVPIGIESSCSMVS